MAISRPVYEDEDSVDEQIRAAAEERSAGKAAPTMDEEVLSSRSADMGNEGKRTSMAVAPVEKRTPMVTKEQLAASGLNLRDYLNKQQGLTRRGDSAPALARMPIRPGQEAPISSNEGRNKMRPRGQGTVMDQGRGVDMYGGAIADIKNMLKGTRRGGSEYAKGGAVKKMASGGSVSSASKRADGIAQRGKTKGKMC